MESIILGGGCFWCLEGVFQQFKGIVSVTSGYTGGDSENPNYKEVCSGHSGHAEVVKIDYNPEEITLSNILEIFFTSHNPTTLNRQGNDVGTQYRSVIYYQNEEEKQKLLWAKESMATEIWADPIVTEIAVLGKFYPAESYHQNYFVNNPDKAYCAYIVGPKIAKSRSKFSHLLK